MAGILVVVTLASLAGVAIGLETRSIALIAVLAGSIILSILFLSGRGLRVVVWVLILRSSLDFWADVTFVGGINLAGALAVLVVCVALLVLARHRRLGVVSGARSVTYMLLIMWGIVSAVLNAHPSVALLIPVAETFRSLSSIAVYWLVVAFVRAKADILRLLRAILLSSLAPLLVGLVGLVTGYRTTYIWGVPGFHRITSVFQHPNNYAHYLLVMLFAWYAYAACARGTGIGVGRPLQLLRAALVVSLFLTFSRSGMLGFFLGHIVLSAKDLRSLMKTLGGLAIVALVVYVLAPSFVLNLPTTIFSDDPSESTLAARFSLWERGKALLPQSQVLGLGPGAFAALLRMPAHNDYLRILAEYGIPGLVLFAVFVLSHLGLGLTLSRHVSVKGPNADLHDVVTGQREANAAFPLSELGRIGAAMTVAVLAVSAGANLFNYPVIQWYVFAVWGVVVSCSEMLRTERTHSHPAVIADET